MSDCEKNEQLTAATFSFAVALPTEDSRLKTQDFRANPTDLMSAAYL